MQLQVPISLLILAAPLLTTCSPTPTSIVPLGSFPAPTYTGSAYANLDLIGKLITAPLQADRIDLLRDRDFVFDFRNPPGNVQVATGNAGRVVVANRKTFPALIGTGSGMALGFLGPFGNLNTSVVLENGSRVINSYISTFQMHVFPQGAIHQEFNPDCGETIFVAGFNNEDPGTSQVADNFFRLPGNVVTAAVGGNIAVDGRDVEQFKNMIPANVAIGVEDCLRRCGLQKRQVM